MGSITFMHHHQPLLSVEMTLFSLSRKHNQEGFLEDEFGTLLFKNL
jgi:hypothetical protein